MHDRERRCLISQRIEPAGRIFPQWPALEFLHQSRYVGGSREHERALCQVHSSVFARPLIDLAGPALVHRPEVAGGEALIHRGDYSIETQAGSCVPSSAKARSCRGFNSPSTHLTLNLSRPIPITIRTRRMTFAVWRIGEKEVRLHSLRRRSPLGPPAIGGRYSPVDRGFEVASAPPSFDELSQVGTRPPRAAWHAARPCPKAIPCHIGSSE